MNNINVANIPTSLYGAPNNVFRLWLEFTRPFHRLTNAKIDVLAYILRKRYDLMLSERDERTVDAMLLSKESRIEICKTLNIDAKSLNVFLHQFRKDNILYKNNTLNHKYIPNICEDSNNFQILINFNIEDDTGKQE